MKKSKIEFYFILYLAAIITLFTIARERDIAMVDLKKSIASLEEANNWLNELIDQINVFNYSISLPKNIYYEIKKDTHCIHTQIKIQGEVLDHEFASKNNLSGLHLNPSINLISAKKVSTNQGFDVKEHLRFNDDASIGLNWKPSISDTGIYQLIFKAKAIPLPPKDLNHSIKEKYSEKLQMKFQENPDALNALFKEKFDTLNITITDNNNGILPPPFALTAQADIVTVLLLSGGENIWENTIIVSGADVNNQLRDLKFSDNSVQVIEKQSNLIRIRGLLDGKNEGPIEISASNSFGFSAKTSFRINTIKPQWKFNSQTAYLNEEYRFDGKLENKSDLDFEIQLWQDGKLVDKNTNVLKIIPKEEGTLLFKRLKNNIEIAEPFKVKVLPPPPPRVIADFMNIEKDKNGKAFITVQTVSYGNVLNGKPNIAILKVEAGGERAEIFGQLETRDTEHKQRWRVPIYFGSPNQSIEVRLFAMDSRGKKSEVNKFTLNVGK